MSVMEGSLSKWTNVVKGWQYRWFVLDETAGLLSYYTSKEKMMRGVRRGCVRLKGAIIGIDDEDDSTFTITVDHKTFHFQARDAEERESWVRALEDTILRHVFRMKWECNRTQPSIADFDNKVAEADAYLQIMIDQTKAIEEQIPNITDLEEQEKYKMLQDQSNTMLDNIKHSIVLLQIAKSQMIVEQFKDAMQRHKELLKNTAYPVNGIYQGPTPRLNSPVRNAGFSPSSSQMGVQTGIELATECIGPQKSNILSGTSSPIILVVPETSYSSSEGEEDFYDANDSPFTSSQVQSPIGVRVFSNESETTATSTDNSTNEKVEIHNSVSDTLSESNNLSNENLRKVSTAVSERTSLPLNDDGSINYDALYDEDIEEDSSLMEAHGSVITHLISQIKIGMDLTKVVLPTFILERRSLLEMYADYFAHPDLFVSIADQKDPKSRMVQVVKWYMASYHAGRKSSVAKKPYNPILGEVFKCWWDLPHDSQENLSSSLNNSTITTSTSDQNVDTSPSLVTDGPVPWGTRDQLTFAAEQVSHHPPISAFYAEHYNKRISFCAHVYTKSKFLGLSVCVYNIGIGKITLLDYNEEYTVTFPNGYGRSILTVPWIELGGQVKIECPQTNYHADVEFLTKPFYSNKKHRITADVYSANDKIPFLKVSGEWNGVMEAKWNDGRTEPFIDVNKLKVVKKKVKPISQQEDNESRRLWKDVTAGLRFNNIEQATQAKSDLEQKQRNEAKERLRTNDKWETKLFQPEGELWNYTTPLSDRIENQL